MKSMRILFHALIISMAAMSLISAAFAQDPELVEPLDLSSEPLVVEFSTSASGPPIIEPLTDGRMTFRIMAAGGVRGDLEGRISARVAEVTAMPSPPRHPVTIMFTIETEQGVIEGYYAGSLYLAEGADQAVIDASGQVLSVSGAYADLYLADVLVSSAVQFVDGRSVGESGTITITPSAEASGDSEASC